MDFDYVLTYDTSPIPEDQPSVLFSGLGLDNYGVSAMLQVYHTKTYSNNIIPPDIYCTLPHEFQEACSLLLNDQKVAIETALQKKSCPVNNNELKTYTTRQDLSFDDFFNNDSF